LNWESLDEHDFSHYEIDRSTDATRFDFIKKINGTNNRNINRYHLNDSNVINGQLYYYRLKMVNLDGTHEYSPIRTALIKSDLAFSIFPNPTNDILKISFEEGIAEEIIIQNASGQEVYRTKVNKNIHQIDVSLFPAGIYFCQIAGSHSTIATKRFVKTN